MVDAFQPANHLFAGMHQVIDRTAGEHQQGRRGARALRGKGPLTLVFQQVVGNRSLASRVEYRVKQLSKKEKEALVAGHRTLPLDAAVSSGD
jgi:putative endonuclease